MAYSSWPGTPSFRTTNIRNGMSRAMATSYPTGTPPRGRARICRPGLPARWVSSPARQRPASLRFSNRVFIRALDPESLHLVSFLFGPFQHLFMSRFVHAFAHQLLG